MDLLTRAAILAVRDLTTERVAVPEWGGEVLVRGLTGEERDAFEEGCYTGRGTSRVENFANLRARLVALAVVDAAGARLFSPTDVAVLGQKSAAALDRIFDIAQRLSGLRKQDVEDLVGNSGPGRGAGPSSASSSGSAA